MLKKILQDGSANFISRTILCLALPASEFVLLRLFVKLGLQQKIGWWHTTDFDFFIAAPVAFAMLMFSLQTARPTPLRLRPRALFLNFGLLFLCVLGAFILLPNATLIWILLVGSTLFSGFFVFFPPQFFFRNPHRAVIFPALLMAFSTALAQNIFDSWWCGWGTRMANLLNSYSPTNLVFEFVKVTDVDRWNVTPGDFYLSMMHPLFAILVGKGCAGFDGILFFVCCNACFFICKPEQSPIRVFWITYLGLGLVLLLCVCRLVVLLYFGVLLRHLFEVGTAVEIFHSFVHYNLGWAMYCAGFGAFYYFLERSAQRKGAVDLKVVVTVGAA